MDIDGSNEIDKRETLKFWNKNFAKLNTDEMFKDLDENNDNKVDRHEWMEFWKRVLASGYTEQEIITELNNIREGKSWAYFELK